MNLSNQLGLTKKKNNNSEKNYSESWFNIYGGLFKKEMTMLMYTITFLCLFFIRLFTYLLFFSFFVLFHLQQFTAIVLRELSNNGGNSIQRHNNASPQSGVVVELAEAKAKIRRWRQELEEKCEQVAELRDELDALKTQSVKIKQENMDLVQEARLSKALRDELDIVLERASKVDRLESELNRYKDKLNDIDYYKARLDELREDNRLLEETKVILEGQLESARQRAELVLDLEGELLKCKSQLTNLLVEKEADKERLKKLAEENAHWQLCTKNCLSESASLTAELESLRAHQAFSDTSKDQFNNLGEQMSSVDLLGKARRLEMENQRLTNLLSSNNAKESGVRGDNSEKILQLEGECTRLKLRLADLEEERRTKENHMTEMMAAVTLRTAEVDRQNQDLQRNHQEQKNLMENLKVLSLDICIHFIYFCITTLVKGSTINRKNSHGTSNFIFTIRFILALHEL